MNAKLLWAVALLGTLFLKPVCAETAALVDRVETTGFLQLDCESFTSLAAKQKALAYWLEQASIATDPIIYDQLSSYGIAQKRLLEEIVAHPGAVSTAMKAKIRNYAKLFFANRGNHNVMTTQKFLPGFTFAEFKGAAHAALVAGAFKSTPPNTTTISNFEQLDAELDRLKAAFFDPNLDPAFTVRTPKDGKDILQASSNTYYEGVSMADVKDFKEHYPLNSRLVKVDGKLQEEVYRAGTADGKHKPGLYAAYLTKAAEFLEKAAALADPDQAKVIQSLIKFYHTGEPSDWLQFGINWVQNNAQVDFANGFIEVYRDARGVKGSCQSFVTVTDQKMAKMMNTLASNAQYFEDHAPWDPKYRKSGVKAPVAKAVEVLVETGDFHVITIGDNLPNENEIHNKYGSKNFIFANSSRALYSAQSLPILKEFAATPEDIQLGEKYGEEATMMMVALHEVIGHGSGKLSDRLIKNPGNYLKEYGSTLEEARADLMALWNISDPRLKELGLVTHPDVMKAMYLNAARAALVQLRLIPTGDTIHEDHQRDRALIANYIADKTGAIKTITKDDEEYTTITDYAKMREGVGMLLKELMRIKAEGDYEAIKALVEKYGVHFDTAVRDRVVARYKKLNLPTYWAGVNVELVPTFDGTGAVTDVKPHYPREPIHQYLRYGGLYNPELTR